MQFAVVPDTYRHLSLPIDNPIQRHIAIGLGDYPYPELSQPTNAELVARIVALARAMGREVATPAEARAMLAL